MAYTPHVLVIGGGVLGTAIARDCALRGLEVTLVEQGTLAAGTTGSIHGLLYSGARFVEENPTAAMRCLTENRTLREIAGHCIEDTEGVVLPAEKGEFDAFVDACEQRSIPASALGRSDLDEIGVADGIDRGVRVPDGVVDPFALTRANATSAENYGAEIKTGASVVELLTDGTDIVGAEVEFDQSPGGVRAPTSPSEDVPEETREPEVDEEEEEPIDAEDDDEEDTPGMPGTVQRSFPGATEDDTPDTGEREEIEADYVVNAAGAWADQIAGLAGIKLPLSRSRGRMVVLSGELTDSAVTRRSDDGYPITAAPYQGNTVVGPIPEPTELEEALAAVEAVLPAASEAAVLRSYTGVWTQHASSSASPYGHDATLVDHEKYDDRWGLLSVIGGSVTTHRFVAEQAVNRVCREFGIGRSCLTADLSLPDTSIRSGDSGPVLCEARSVGREAVRSAIDASEPEPELANVRTQTGATMGECQGGRCGHRIAAELYPDHDHETVDESLETLLQRRWRGRRETLADDQLAAALDDYEFHARLLGRDDERQEEVDTDSFDESGFTIPERSRADQRYRGEDSVLPVIDGVPRGTDGRAKCSEAVGQ
ncbi:FAD-dependent oxidoreductase [Halovenus sp. WSH3]|uniref:FAD-dependent oxidoreductase n=1 Tax=Halovenus carboxidivorans TaxID=2692199 RepID=A0A6B0T1M8_9EURY|nr:FAD-dependent oxidoreductase [Halovenus carboxidivorans]MXR51954.1 FAD-dependent oxidoreductase [Halovenus carboxidivorans]